MAGKRSAPETASEEMEGERAAEPLDHAHLARYTLGERELEREVLQLFCAQSKLYLAQLRAAASDKEWRDAAHSLRGSARAVGAWRAAAAAARAEALAGASAAQARARAQRLSEIEATLREAEMHIEPLLAAP